MQNEINASLRTKRAFRKVQLRPRAGFNSFLFGFCYCLLVFFPFKLPEFLPLPLPHLLQRRAWSVYPKQTGSKAKAELRTSHRPLPGCWFPFQRAPDKKGCVSVVFKRRSEAGKALVLLAAATAVTWQEIFFLLYFFFFLPFLPSLPFPFLLLSLLPFPVPLFLFLIFLFILRQKGADDIIHQDCTSEQLQNLVNSRSAKL